MRTVQTGEVAGVSPAADAQRHARMVGWLVRTELLKLVRVPAFMVPTVLFPTLFFAMFALPHVNDTLSGVNAGAFMLVSYSAYALLSVALFSFGVAVAAERGAGWVRLLRVTPLAPGWYFLAKLLAGMLVGLLAVGILVAFAFVVGGVRVNALTLLLVVAKLLLGMTPFVALGLLIGFAAGPTSAAAVANVVFLPLAFASGLFVPVEVGPRFLQTLAPFMPGYHFAQLGWGTLGARSEGAEWVHWAYLALYALVFLLLAGVAYRRDQGQREG